MSTIHLDGCCSGLNNYRTLKAVERPLKDAEFPNGLTHSVALWCDVPFTTNSTPCRAFVLCILIPFAGVIVQKLGTFNMAARSALHYLKYLNFSHKRHFHQRIDHLQEMVVQLEKTLQALCESSQRIRGAIFIPLEELILPFIQSDNQTEMSYTVHLKLFYKRFENFLIHIEPSSTFLKRYGWELTA